MQFERGRKKTGGRRKGTPNKSTALLKDAILEAAEKAGGVDGVTGYLEKQAREQPAAFLSLIAKILPKDLEQKPQITIVMSEDQAKL